jgi:hypothetical protein
LKTKHKFVFTFVPSEQLSACGFSDLCPEAIKKHPKSTRKENPKGFDEAK